MQTVCLAICSDYITWLHSSWCLKVLAENCVIGIRQRRFLETLRSELCFWYVCSWAAACFFLIWVLLFLSSTPTLLFVICLLFHFSWPWALVEKLFRDRTCFKEILYIKHLLLVPHHLDLKWDGKPQWQGDLGGKLYGGDEEFFFCYQCRKAGCIPRTSFQRNLHGISLYLWERRKLISHSPCSRVCNGDSRSDDLAVLCMMLCLTFALNRWTFLIAGAELWEPSAPSFQLQKFVFLIKSGSF